MNCGHQMPEFEERLEGGCIVCWHDRAEKAESAFKEERTEWVSVARLEAAVDILNRIASHKIDTTDCADVTGSEEPIECVAEWVAERMIDFQNAQDKAERDRDKAQAACAEMRLMLINTAHRLRTAHKMHPEVLEICAGDIESRMVPTAEGCGVGWLSPEKKKVLVEALQGLMDEQNGPPLIRHQQAWEAAMQKAKDAIAAVEGKP